jgi:hypothetical protein
MDASIREKIERRAYEIFLSRGGDHGSHEDDWERAEKEIMDELSNKKTANKIQQIEIEEPSPTSETDLEHVVPEVKETKSKREANITSSTTAAPAKKRSVKKKSADA